MMAASFNTIIRIIDRWWRVYLFKSDFLFVFIGKNIWVSLYISVPPPPVEFNV